MHLHWIANCVVPPPKSHGGGDRIMVECLRRWKREHRVTIYGWEGTRELCEYQGLEGVEHVLWPSARYTRLGFFGHFAAETLIGCRAAGRLVLPGPLPSSKGASVPEGENRLTPPHSSPWKGEEIPGVRAGFSPFPRGRGRGGLPSPGREAGQDACDVTAVGDDEAFPAGEAHVIVSASDFPPDSLPALRLKRRHPHIPWVAAFFLFAPPIWDVLRGYPGPGLLFSAYRPLQRWILPRILREAEMILVTGEEDRERMIALGRAPESVFAVRGGVDLSIPRSVPDPIEKSYDAVFIGRFHPQKGVRELVRIWKLLQEKKAGARLAMIGKGPLEAELLRLRASLGLERAVDFLGFQDGAEKYRIIKSARVVVHPAIYDSGGMAPAEALACGLPGVAFDLPALETYYPKGFLKVPQGDLAAFAARLVALLEDPGLYAAMSAEARRAGAEWDWDLRAKQVLDAILSVVPR